MKYLYNFSYIICRYSERYSKNSQINANSLHTVKYEVRSSKIKCELNVSASNKFISYGNTNNGLVHCNAYKSETYVLNIASSRVQRAPPCQASFDLSEFLLLRRNYPTISKTLPALEYLHPPSHRRLFPREAADFLSLSPGKI